MVAVFFFGFLSPRTPPVAAMTVITLARPLAQPHAFEGGSDMDLSPDPVAKFLGYGVLVAIAALYVIFR